MKQRGCCSGEQCSGRLQMAAFVRGCLSMFSGSFQYNFLPLSIGMKPVNGQNEARTLIAADGERRAKPGRHAGREKVGRRSESTKGCWLIRFAATWTTLWTFKWALMNHAFRNYSSVSDQLSSAMTAEEAVSNHVPNFKLQNSSGGPGSEMESFTTTGLLYIWKH